MAKEEELKRVDLKVNVSCCDGCRRKVMKAMNLKGVLRTEIHPSLDRVTVVGNVDTKVLVKKLAKVGKIAEVVEAAVPEQQKKREGDGGKDRDGGDWTAPAPGMAGEKSKRKEDGMDNGGNKPAAASSKKECTKCAHQHKQSARGGGDADDHGKKAKGAAGDETSAFKQEADGFAAEAKASAPDHAPAAAHHNYYRAEPPSMAVPMQYMPTMPYYAAANVTAPSYYNGGGYYAMPPPPPAPMPWQPPHQQQQLVRPQPSRFDVDYFNEDNAVGCHIM
ncbi:heavy metal-associated isoprenylated plant protein 33-like [Triticum dicoccoides]|uniref:heavy metal-associated isoprenylated plant protein 33-like n=1 Tax=Triticum dicoccoides TaxID=85692 RepID=UPI00084554BE|nr:heavy metal-associated isoprenylated plant protein 33-like [Triticum dicoccoides]XP_037479019.1 heavy metal-associated isoprenylated plant protein 33-like [Triticum dicoccoides]XP_037479020.1 heavy metal-associated isoprenylated plant protein 33-like [Triticum dicoccoides]XP_044453649.1 heavy metal-associated isoprenylated plant protein 33-like [Triticum aestivum]